MEHMKTPVVNDTLYGASKNNLIPTDSIALHSASLKFNFDNEVHSFETNEPSFFNRVLDCLLYTSPSPRDQRGSRMPSSA